MDEETDLQSAKNELHTKIGRNLLMFQRAEALLKGSLMIGGMKLRLGKIEEDLESHKQSFEKVTLGQAANRFFENHIGIEGPPDPSEVPSIQIHASHGFGSAEQPDEAAAQDFKDTLDRLVEQRNHFIHHLHLDLELTSLQSLRQLTERLDQQHQDFKNFIELLSRIAGGFVQSFSHAQQMTIPAMIMGSELYHELISLATTHRRSDGWTSFKTVAEIITQRDPGLIQRELASFGMDSLTEFALASKCFQTLKEPTESGGIRSLYRETALILKNDPILSPSEPNMEFVREGYIPT